MTPSAGRVARPVRRVVQTSAVDATVALLRDVLLDREDGEWLGSEDDLLDRLGVSRPTLRQAARLLEAEELLVVRRGPNGGLFARRPSTDAVARMAAVYLRSEGTTIVDLTRSWLLVLEESARRAATDVEPARVAAIAEDFERLWDEAAGGDVHSQIAATHAFAAHLAELSGSTTLRLFVHVLTTLIAATPADVLEIDWGAMFKGTAHTNLRAVLGAIERGDGEQAARRIRQHGQLMIERLEAEMPDRTL